MHGQQDGSVLWQLNGRVNMLPASEQACHPTLALVPREEPLPVSGVLARGGELYSGRRVQVDSVVSRMEATAGSVSTNHKNIQRMHDGSPYLMVGCPVELVCELETGPRGSRDKCPTSGLG